MTDNEVINYYNKDYNVNNDFVKKELLGQTMKQAEWTISNNDVYENELYKGLLITEIVEVMRNGEGIYYDECLYCPNRNAITLGVETRDGKIIGFKTLESYGILYY